MASDNWIDVEGVSFSTKLSDFSVSAEPIRREILLQINGTSEQIAMELDIETAKALRDRLTQTLEELDARFL